MQRDPVTGAILADEGDKYLDEFDESLTQIRKSQFEQWSVGIDFSYPIGNRTARASVRQARLEKERALMNTAKTRMTILQEARAALRDVRDAYAQTQAAQTATELAKEQYEAELIRLENDRSTTFQVRESQRDWFEAQDTETRAIVDFEIFRARLQQVQGKLAQDYGVIWEPDLVEPGAIIEP